MGEFAIRVRSVKQVQAFVDLATSCPFRIFVGDSRHEVNGKSFMEMFSLNFGDPLVVRAECSEEELVRLAQAVTAITCPL